MKNQKKILLLLTFLLSGHCLVLSQATDNNEYYRYPVSFGLGYISSTPLTAYPVPLSLHGLTGTITLPLANQPFLQPMVQLGSLWCRSDKGQSEWDHDRWQLLFGINAGNRLSKHLEIGAGLAAGYEYAIFSRLAEGRQAAGSWLAQAAGRIGINPNFNLNIELAPHFKFSYSSLDHFRFFDGFSVGLALSLNWRPGEDPDAPGSMIRSLRFSDLTTKPIFAAMQSYYADHPIGSVSITNTDKNPVLDLTVLFYQGNYMDAPKAAAHIDLLKPGESQKVDLYALFNHDIFQIEGTIPVSAEIIANYTSQRRAAEQRHPVPLELRDKTAIIWDDDRKAAAFVTAADSAIRNYASFIRRSGLSAMVPSLSESLQSAMLVYHALAEFGLVYQLDPVLPFSKAQGDEQVVDSVNLPRDTLARGAGDCDDLTVLFAAILESAGIETGYVTVPGHIFPVFNTKIPARSWQLVHPDREQLIMYNGEVWVPIEITLIGRTNFLEAWRSAAQQYYELENNPSVREFVVVRQAQAVFKPVGLRETDLGLQYGRPEAIRSVFEAELLRLSVHATAPLASRAEQERSKQAYNRLGIELARFARYKDAEQAFRRALALDSAFVEARINLGNVLLLAKNYTEALSVYRQVETAIGTSSRPTVIQALHTALAACYSALGDEASASRYRSSHAPALAAGGTGAAVSEGRAASANQTQFMQLFLAETD